MSRVCGLALLASFACAAGLLCPSGALGQAGVRVVGSPLVNPANSTFGCEVRPRAFGGTPGYENQPYGELVPTASGAADCTWSLAGVFGRTTFEEDPRVGSVPGPGTGTITRIRVKSGPNPAIIRFTVGEAQSTICCFFRAETAPTRPKPNDITSYAVNLPVDSGTKAGGKRIDSFVGLTAVSGTGSIPLHDTGLHNTIGNGSTPGNPNAGAIYPRLAPANGGDGAGQVADGNPGFEVLMELTWCAQGAACERQIGGGDGGRDLAAPVLGRPAVRPNAFRVARGATPVAAKVAKGSKLRFSLNEAAAVQIRIQRPKAGRRSKGTCRKPTRKLRKAKRCTRWVKAGTTLTRKSVPAGNATIAFTGRIGKKALKRGRYRAAITARDGAGNRSKVTSARFRIVR